MSPHRTRPRAEIARVESAVGIGVVVKNNVAVLARPVTVMLQQIVVTASGLIVRIEREVNVYERREPAKMISRDATRSAPILRQISFS